MVKLRRMALLGLGIGLCGALAYLAWPRAASLRRFSPQAIGHMETAMWRSYYEHRYVALFHQLYRMNREQYGFSPWTSFRIAYCAAKAANVFQPSTSRAEARAAIPWLVRYYGIIKADTREPFDVQRAAELELDWWQQRREDATPAEYGKVIAQVAAEVYQTDNDDIQQASALRAAMMQFRDERSRGRMREQDWYIVEDGLGRAFALLKHAVSGERSRAKPASAHAKPASAHAFTD